MNFDWGSYRQAVDNNRRAAQEIVGWAVPVVEGMVNSLQQTASELGTTPDPVGRSHAGLAGFSQLTSRAVVWSLDRLLGCQPVLGWLALRPGLESALIIGKLRDDVGNAQIWRSRRESKRAMNAYRSTFSGKALISSSLPRSGELQSVLSRINSYFVHPNPEYLASQTEITDVGFGVLASVEFLEGDGDLLEAHVLSLVHLQAVLHESLSLCLRRGLGIVEPGIPYDPQPVLEEKKVRASALSKARPEAADLLQELGLWKLDDVVL